MVFMLAARWTARGRFLAGLGLGFFLIIGLVEPRALKYYPRAAAYKALHLTLAFRAFLDELIVHRLEDLEYMFAFLALVIISRHSDSPL